MRIKFIHRSVSIAIFALVLFSSYSFVSTKNEPLGVILNHTRPGTTVQVLIAIPKEEPERIDCHLTHGDTEYPYEERLYKSLIITQEDGDGYCKS